MFNYPDYRSSRLGFGYKRPRIGGVMDGIESAQSGLRSAIATEEKKGYVPSGDHVYFNFSIQGASSAGISAGTAGLTLAEKDETYQQPLLERPSDWQMSVLRLKCPTSYVPLFDYVPGSCIVAITYGTSISRATVNVAPYVADASTPNTVWSIDSFVNAVNAAISSAYDLAILAGFPASPKLPPFISYDPASSLMSISFEQTWWETGRNANIGSLYFNTNLYEGFFSSFQGLYSQLINGVTPWATDLDVLILLKQNAALPLAASPLIVCQAGGLTSDGANPSTITWTNAPVQHGLSVTGQMNNKVVAISGCSPAGFNGIFVVATTASAFTFTYTAAGVVAAGAATGAPSMVALPRGSQIPGQFNTLTEETPSVAGWDQFVSLRLVTRSVPVRPEWLPTSGVGSVGTRQILTDFNPSFTDRLDTRNYLQYFPPGEYRRIDLVSEEPLRRFDCQCLWVDRAGAEHPVYIPNGESVDIKFLFERKHAARGL